MKLIQLFDIKTRTLCFAFCQLQKSPYQNLSPKKSHYKISNPKKVHRSHISNPKRALHIPVTNIPEYPPPPPPNPATISLCDKPLRAYTHSNSVTFTHFHFTHKLVGSRWGSCNCLLPSAIQNNSIYSFIYSFCRCNHMHEFRPVWICATCFGGKILSQSQRFPM